MEGKGALESPLCSWDFQLCIWDKVDLDEALASLRGGYHWHKSAGLLRHGCVPGKGPRSTQILDCVIFWLG